jgi:hypothetical protein
MANADPDSSPIISDQTGLDRDGDGHLILLFEVTAAIGVRPVGRLSVRNGRKLLQRRVLSRARRPAAQRTDAPGPADKLASCGTPCGLEIGGIDAGTAA